MGALVAPVAFVLASLVSVDLLSLLSPRPAALAAGAAATAPLLAFLVWFMRSQWRPVSEFRRSQIKFFSEIGFRFTRLRNVLLSLVAGVGEELLFRGVLQTLAERQFPILAAIVIPNILFAALHARTPLYALAAGLVGIYLGALFWMTESLAAAIIAHGLYDLVALEWTRRILGRPSMSSS